MKKRDIYSGDRTQRPAEVTPLSLWLTAHGVSRFEMARRLGCDPKLVGLWAAGRVKIGLDYAFMLEKETEGGVPAVSWLGTELFKHRMRSMGSDWERLNEQRTAERRRRRGQSRG